MSTLTNLQVKLYSTKEEPVNPDIPDTGAPDTGLMTVIDSTNGQDGINIDIAPIAFTAFVLLIVVAFVLPKLVKKIHKKDAERYDLNSKKFRNFRFLSTILASSSLLIGLVSTAMGYVPQKDDDLSIDAAEKVTIDAPILDTDDIAVVHSTIKIPASTGDNTKLYITSVSSDLVDMTNSTHKIPSITEKGTLKDNTYGIYVGKDKPTANSEFYPVYSDDKGIYSLFQADPTKETVVDIWYGVRSKSNIGSTYETNLKVEALSTSRFAMQEMTPELCASFEQGVYDLYEMYDTRDGKIYNIARYEDGNCWMTSTLDLDLDPSRTLTSADTNLPEGMTYTPNIATSTKIEKWEYLNPFSDENEPRLKEYIRLRLNLNSTSCNEDNERWCKEEGEEGYIEWPTIRDYISGSLAGSYPYVWDKDSTIDSWSPLTSKDYAVIREKLLNYFGVEELTEKEKQWNSMFNNMISNSENTVLVDKWDEFWQIDGDCDKITTGNEYHSVDEYRTFCRRQVDHLSNIIDEETYTYGTYKNFPQYSLDTGKQSDGNYYNLLSATASTTEINLETGESSATGSICPANWHLATKADFKHIISANDIHVAEDPDGTATYDKKLSSSSDFLTNNGLYLATEDEFFSQFLTAPGIYKEISFSDEEAAQIGFSRMSFESFSNLGYYIEVDMPGGDYMVVSITSYKSMLENGLSVRCVADGEFSVSFDGNSDSKVDNLPKSDSKEKTAANEETGATFTIPNTIPTRTDGVKFLGWANSRTNAANFIISYRPGDNITVFGMVTLYAVWDIEQYESEKAIYTENGYLTFVKDTKYYVEGVEKYKTKNGEESTITKVFREDAFKYEKKTDGLSIAELDNANTGGDSALTAFQSFVPGWSPIHDLHDNDGDGIADEELNADKYSTYVFAESFKKCKPDDLQFWFFAAGANVNFEDLENIDTINATNMTGTFALVRPGQDSPVVKNLDLSTWKTENVTNMDGMFSVSGPYSELGLENWNTSNVTSMANMFSFMYGDIQLDLSKWDTSKVTDISSMFYGTATSNVKISGVQNWNTSNVTNMHETFRGAYLAYDSLDLSRWNTAKVTDMSGMFTTLIVEKPDGVEETTLNLRGWNTSNVTNMSSMFGKHTHEFSLAGTQVDVLDLSSKDDEPYYSDWNTNKATNMDNMFNSGSYKTIKVSRDWSGYIKVPFYDCEQGITDGDDYYVYKDVNNGNTPVCVKKSDKDSEIFEIDEDGNYYIKEGSVFSVDSTTGDYKITKGATHNFYGGPYGVKGSYHIIKDNEGQIKEIVAFSANDIFEGSDNLVGGNGTANKNGDKYRSLAYARPDTADQPGLFTTIYDNTFVNEPEDISTSPSYYGGSIAPTDEPGDTTTPTNPQDGNTTPHGVITKARAADRTDYALIIVITISAILTILGFIIILLIEKRDKDEDDDVEEY